MLVFRRCLICPYSLAINASNMPPSIGYLLLQISSVPRGLPTHKAALLKNTHRPLRGLKTRHLGTMSNSRGSDAF